MLGWDPRANDIFLKALEIPDAGSRKALLADVCGTDSELRLRVESLLAASADAGSFLAVPEHEPAPSLMHEKPGDVIGPYKLLQVIGEGGMGTVYMAEQTHPVQRKVALKVVKAGMGSTEVIARFGAERQALALMDHPNIAKVLDAGATASGRPFFVMELVKGVSLTKYCDERRLTPQQRLEIFLPVCHAVQHAHQKGVIHRDIKPSNVLVALYDSRPVPKVIDFGVAKAAGPRLTDKTLFTEFGSVVGTLEYMSPEQAELNQLDIDTRSDIYSLGVLLYELLTGTTPLERKQLAATALLEALRLIRETEPPAPSTRLSSAEELQSIAASRGLEPRKLSGLMRGDLDWIVMKALEKDRNRRYETADGFAMDVQRYLADEPVWARPPSAAYRVRKFLRRYRGPVLAASVFLLTLVAGAVVSAWQAVRATRAGEEAAESESRALRQEALANLAESERAEQLWQSYRDQARANRLSGHPGRRFNSLETLQKALAIVRERKVSGDRYLLDFRNEAIAALTLADFGAGRAWEGFLPNTTAVACDATFEHYARGNERGDVTVLTVAEDREVRHFQLPGAPIGSLGFSPDGRYLLTGPVIRLWDWRSGEEALVRLSGGLGHDFRADGGRLAVGQQDGTIALYDLPSGARAATLPAAGLTPQFVVFDPAGKRLAVSHENLDTVQVREAHTGKVLAELSPIPGAFTPAWSGDGKVLAVAANYSHSRGVIQLYDATSTSYALLGTLEGHTNQVRDLAFNRAGTLLTSSSWDGTFRLWDVRSRRQLVRGLVSPAGHFSRDGRLLGPFKEGSKLRLAEVADGRECRVLAGVRGHLAFSPGERLVASAEDDGVHFWDVITGEPIATLPWPGTRASYFLPEGKGLVVVTAEAVYRCSIERARGPEGAHLRIGPPEILWRGTLHNACLATDGRTLAGNIATKRGLLLDLEHPDRPIWLDGHPNVLYVSVSPDRRWAATGTWHGSGIKIWDARNGQFHRDLDIRRTAAFGGAFPLFSPDGRWLATGAGWEYRLWEVGSWEEPRHVIPKSHEGPGVVVFSSDGSLMAVRHSVHLIKLIDPATGRELASLEPPFSSQVDQLVMSPGGTRLAAQSRTELAGVWDLRLIRRQLAARGLDWDLPPYPSEAEAGALPLRVELPASAPDPAMK